MRVAWRDDRRARGSRRMARAALAAVAALVGLLAAEGPASRLHAQAETREVDSGRFHVYRGGERTATEVFAIRREGSSLRSAARLMTGSDTTLLADRIVEARLQTDAEGQPELFELRVQRGSGPSLVGVRSGSRFRVRTRSSAGERWREYLLRSNFVILPAGFVHFHHFLFGRNGGGAAGETLTALLPADGTEHTVRFHGRAPDTVRAAGRPTAATRWEVTVGGERRLVWRSGDGRILRVEIPADDWVARRVPGSGPAGPIDPGRPGGEGPAYRSRGSP